jgi:hypothetical protein
MKRLTNFVLPLFLTAMFFSANTSLLFAIVHDEAQDYSPDDPHFGELLKQKQELQRIETQKQHEYTLEYQKVTAQKAAIEKYLLDSHLKELQSLKPKQTPDGKKTGLDMFNFPELDGSTSCLNLGAIVMSYVLGVPYKWEMEVQQSSYNDSNKNKLPFFRTYPPLPDTNYNRHGGYNHLHSVIELKVVADLEKTNFRRRNFFRLCYGQFQGTYGAYLSLIGKPKKEDPSYNDYPRIPRSGNYNLLADKGGRFPSVDPTITSDHEGRLAFPQSEILLVVRRPSEDEKRAMERAEVELDIHPIALDGFVFVINRKNPVESLTLEQIQFIYASPQQKLWKDYGGNEKQEMIHYYGHLRNSGSRELMDKLVTTPEVLQKYRKQSTEEKSRDYNSVSGVDDDERDIFSSLQQNRNAIGYSVYHYEHFMLRVPETRVLAVNGVFPNYENIRTKKYPLVYEIYVVTRKEIPNDSPAAKLRDWLQSDDGQRAVRESGYVPINPKIAAE